MRNLRTVNKLFYEKEPDMHEFYVDFDKKIMYKCWSLNYSKEHENEVRIFKSLEGAKYIPKLYKEYKTYSSYVLEMEFIPCPPIWGFIRLRTPWKNSTYSKRQKELMLNQFDNIYNDLKSKRLIDEQDNITFELSQNNLIFDHMRDKLMIYDFQIVNDKAEPRRKDIIKFINELPEGDEFDIIIDREKAVKHLICTEPGWTKEDYEEGTRIIKDIERVGPVYIYQSVFINGQLIKGQISPVLERMEVIKPRIEDIVGKNVVDIGCNIGEVLVYCARLGADTARGVDRCDIAVPIGKRYINYLKKSYMNHNHIYDRVDITHGNAEDFDYNNADTIFYLGCFGHFGTPQYHAKVGQHAKTIYFGGHAMENERERMENTMPWFGDFKWTYVGSYDEGVDESGIPRPVYRGDRI